MWTSVSPCRRHAERAEPQRRELRHCILPIVHHLNIGLLGRRLKGGGRRVHHKHARLGRTHHDELDHTIEQRGGVLAVAVLGGALGVGDYTRPLFRLNVNAFCGIGGSFWVCLGGG